MRTSLREVELIEQAMFFKKEEYQCLLEAKSELDPGIAERVAHQQMTYPLIIEYGRAQLKKEIQTVDHQLFHSSEHMSFRKRILSIFKK